MEDIFKIIDKYHKQLNVSEKEKLGVYGQIVDCDEDDLNQSMMSIWNNNRDETLSNEAISEEFDKFSKTVWPEAAAIDETSRETRKPRLNINLVWWSCAAVLILGMFAFMQFHLNRVEIIETSLVEEYVPLGQIKSVKLPDGSIVYLNSGSLLVYPSSFAGTKREVNLYGEGFFCVQKDESKPFVVKTRNLSVAVVGTRFNLYAYPEAKRTVTTLEQGRVNVILGATDSIVSLRPDEQLILNNNGEGRFVKYTVESERYRTWINHELMFDNTPLSDVLLAIENKYNVKIQVQNNVKTDTHISISFSRNTTPERMMELIQNLIPKLRYTITGGDK